MLILPSSKIGFAAVGLGLLIVFGALPELHFPLWFFSPWDWKILVQ